MKYLVLSGLLILSTSCALLNNLKNDLVGFNYSDLHHGVAIQEALDIRGPAIESFEVAHDRMFLYKDGFIHSRNGSVVNKGSYQFTMSEDELLSDYVINGSDLFEVVPKLGLPKSISKKETNITITYNRGALYSSGPRIVMVADRVYDDLVFSLGMNAFSDKSADVKGPYYIMPGSEKLSPEDFQFKEMKGLLSAALVKQGLVMTEDAQTAKYVILVKYGISDPKEDIEIISKPVFMGGFMGGGVDANGAPMGGGMWTAQGQQIETKKNISYSRWFNIEAVDHAYLLRTKTVKPVWKVLTKSVGFSGDLRFVLPALIYGATNYINEDTKKELTFTVESSVLNEFIYESKFSDHPARTLAGKK